MSKYFGTDGFRGEAGKELTALHAFKTGRYLGYYLKKKKKCPRVAIGKDTRLSSYMLEYSIAAGLSASGVDVFLLHVTTTPSVSYITVSDGFDAGVMITASHNPYYDNGIKIIDSEGKKLGEELTDEIEEYIDARTDDIPMVRGEDIGKIHDYYSGRNRYVGYLISLVSNSYKGMKVGLDCANGAAFAIARSVFSSVGAEVHAIGDLPNGLNVNADCGSTHPEALCELVREKGLDIGFAFDGDADRCIAVDADGQLVDGDKILYLLAQRLDRLGMLHERAVVATVMSNGGLVKALSKRGIRTVLTQVGDRFVYEKMRKIGAPLGGEQSGHIIVNKYATTGDGILTALLICEEMCDTEKPLGRLVEDVVLYPQITKSVRVKSKSQAVCDPELERVKKLCEDELSPSGRLLIRESGTEPKLRIMAEHEDEALCQKCVNSIIDVLRKRGHLDA